MDQGVRWENFEESSVSLTEEEQEFALRAALEKKIANIREILWAEKTRREKEKNKKLDPNQVLHIAATSICKEANLNIGEFVLTPEFEIYRILALYFSGNEGFAKIEEFSMEKGLILFGNVGCGKTTAINAFRTIAVTTFPIFSCTKISNEYQKDGAGSIERYINLPEVCFDDLGIETSSKHFGDEKNVMAEIIHGRYDKFISEGFKTHFTSNLAPEEVERFYGLRIRSRLREMCNQIEFPETSEDKRK